MESKILRKKECSKLARRDFFTPYLLGLSFLPLLLAFLLFCGILYGANLYVVLYGFLRVDFGFSSTWLAWAVIKIFVAMFLMRV